MAKAVTSNKPAVLLIGGVDPQGCAGLTADTLTVSHHGCHPLPLATAQTEQSTKGLSNLGAVEADAFMRQFANIQQDFEIQAVKIGLIPNLAIAKNIATILSALPAVPVVYDPVLASTSGGMEVPSIVQDFVLKTLLPSIDLLTPNTVELGQLVSGYSNANEAVESLLEGGLSHCLVKGGHAESDYATDYFASIDTAFYCYQNKLAVGNVRGTGCVLASSLASHLACGQDMRDAVVLAKAYVHRGMRLSVSVGPYRVIEHRHDALDLIDFPKLCYQAEFVGKEFSFPQCPARLGIYPVVDTADWVEKLVDLGIKTIQLRIKEQTAANINTAIQQAVGYLKNEQVQFFVNDYWQPAIQHSAYGVHLGQEDLHDAQLDKIAAAGLRLGVSTHSYWELSRALAINPSYIALGPIYATTSKQMPFAPQGEARLAQWVDLLAEHYPLVAIGGIDLARAKKLKSTGVGSVAMISAITKADDYQQATKDLLDCWT